MTGQDSSDWLGLSGRVCVVTGGGGGIGRARPSVSPAPAPASRRSISTNAGLKVRTRSCASSAMAISSFAATPPASRASPPHPRRSRNRSGPATSWSTPRRCCVPARSTICLLPNGTRVLAVNLTGYFLCAQVFGRQMRALGRGSLVHVVVDCRQQRAGAERRLQRQQGRRDHAVAAARQRMGAAWHPQQRRQPRHGDHADEPGILRYAGGDRAALRRGAACGGSACRRIWPT